MYSIIIEDIYSYQSSMVVGLKITGECPVFVGCSMRNHLGEIIDRPG